jgi:ATP-binding cassette subfamily F protein uup
MTILQNVVWNQKAEEEIGKEVTNYSKLNELMQEKERLEKTLEEKMDRWVYLNDLAAQTEEGKRID